MGKKRRKANQRRIHELEYQLGLREDPPPLPAPNGRPGEVLSFDGAMKEIYTSPLTVKAPSLPTLEAICLEVYNRGVLPPFVDHIEMQVDPDPFRDRLIITVFPAYKPAEPIYARVDMYALSRELAFEPSLAQAIDFEIAHAIKLLDPMRR